MKKKVMIYLFIFIVSFCFINNVKAVFSEENYLKNTTYEKELLKFPKSYQEKIKELHKIYPNAIFIAQSKFLDWDKYKEVEVDWNDMLKAENSNYKSEIEASAPAKYKTSTCDKSGCGWVVASKEGIEYYMDPYNFLDKKHIFMFQSQYFNPSYQTKEGVEKILSTTFMANTKCPGAEMNGVERTYAEVIMEAANKYKMSPYLLAARLKQENGKGTSPLVTGDYSKYDFEKDPDTTYYNYFNIQASGANIIENGYKCANGSLENSKGKKLCAGYSWTTPYLSIMGGSEFLYKKYVGVNDTYNVMGQMNLYLQKWDPYGPQYAGHQYMQNIRAPYFESESLYNSYNIYKNFEEYKFVFYIPIFKNAPSVDIVVKIGDLNNDNVIDSADLLKMRQHLIGTKKLTNEYLVLADINKDGNIDSTDLLKIRQHLIGIKKIEW